MLPVCDGCDRSDEGWGVVRSHLIGGGGALAVGGFGRACPTLSAF